MKKSSIMLLCMALSFAIADPAALCIRVVEASDSPAVAEGAIAADSSDYIIGPEDVLLIYVWREDTLTRTVPVRMDGKISLPLVNDVHAADLTPLELKEQLTEQLREFIENPTVSVTVMEANSFKVYLSGEVKKPGVHLLRTETTLLRLIIGAGGFTEWANPRRILIIRNEGGKEKRINADYRKILEGTEPDIPIKRGDTIIVR